MPASASVTRAETSKVPRLVKASAAGVTLSMTGGVASTVSARSTRVTLPTASDTTTATMAWPGARARRAVNVPSGRTSAGEPATRRGSAPSPHSTSATEPRIVTKPPASAATKAPSLSSRLTRGPVRSTLYVCVARPISPAAFSASTVTVWPMPACTAGSRRNRLFACTGATTPLTRTARIDVSRSVASPSTRSVPALVQALGVG